MSKLEGGRARWEYGASAALMYDPTQACQLSPMSSIHQAERPDMRLNNEYSPYSLPKRSTFVPGLSVTFPSTG